MVKLKDTKFGKFANSTEGYMTKAAIDMASMAARGVQNMRNANLGDLARPDDGALAMKDAQYAIAKSIPGPVGMIAGIAEGVDNILGGITGGLGSATGLDRTMSAIPLLGNTAAIFARRTKSFKGDITDINTGDFGGTVAAAQEAKSASGGKSLAAGKVNRMIDEAQTQFDMATDIVERNKKLRDNNISQDILARTTNKYFGNQQTYSLVGKKGMMIPSLDAARKILKNKNNSAIAKTIVADNDANDNNRNASTVIEMVNRANDGLSVNDVKAILEDVALMDDAKNKTIYSIKNNSEYLKKYFKDHGLNYYSSLIDDPENNYLDIISILKSSEGIKQFKSGGKIEKDNIIPTGAMHKNLHHIEENNPELEGQITKKGIPVGIFDEDGKFEQICEVESNELILSLENTKQIEEYKNSYDESKEDSFAIDCGKFLVEQLFKNTEDPNKVIKNTN